MLYHPREKCLWDFWLFHHDRDSDSGASGDITGSPERSEGIGACPRKRLSGDTIRFASSASRRIPATSAHCPNRSHHQGTTHLFYLQLMEGDSWRRIGHATSTDLLHWTEEAPALPPGTGDDWDNAPLGSGMVFEHKGKFYMMYFTHVPKTANQRMGLATSDDLFTWVKHSANPIMTPGLGSEIYENDPEKLLDETPSWRDPFIRYDPDDGMFHALMAARLAKGSYAHRGCVGHAVSKDLVHWEARPPIYAPGRFYDYEAPELDKIGDNYYLVWSCIDAYVNHYEPTSRRRCGGTWYAVSDKPYEGFTEPADNLLVGSGNGRWDNYVGRVLRIGSESLLFYFMRGGSEVSYTSLSAPKTLRTTQGRELIPGYCSRVDDLKKRPIIPSVQREWVDAKKCLNGERWSLNDGVLSAEVNGSFALPTGVGAGNFLLECELMLEDAFFAGVGMTNAFQPGQPTRLKWDKVVINAGAVVDGKAGEVHVLANTAGKTGAILKPLDSARFSVRNGGFHHLRMMVRRPWTDIFFDDRLYFSLALPWPEDGELALLACDGRARFRNLRVHEFE